MIDAILWDNDGILVDTEHVYFQATQHVLRSVGVPLSEADYLDLFLVQGKGAWHLAEAHGVPAGDLDRLRDERNALYGRWLADAPRLIPGVDRVLESLHVRYTMGVVTSSRRDHFDVIHRNTNLLQYFDFAITSDDCTRVKPDPEPYRRAIERTGFDVSRCVAVEDSQRGLQAAIAAGLDCLVIPTALTRSCAFVGALRVLESIDEVPEAVAALATSKRSG
ncbi:MAG: HAD family phosphatase [Vicinamibacterales bacterium]